MKSFGIASGAAFIKQFAFKPPVTRRWKKRVRTSV